MRYALLTTSLLLLIPAAAEAQVPGSYRRSCNSIQFDGQTITANCRRVYGGYSETSIDIERCGRSDIANRNGRLVCGPNQGSTRAIDGYGRSRGYGYNSDDNDGYRPRYAPPPPDDDYAPRRRRYDPNGDY